MMKLSTWAMIFSSFSSLRESPKKHDHCGYRVKLIYIKKRKVSLHCHPHVRSPDRPWPEEGQQFSTLWCRLVSASCGEWNFRLRDYPQSLLLMKDVEIWGRLIGAEQKASKRGERRGVLWVGCWLICLWVVKGWEGVSGVCCLGGSMLDREFNVCFLFLFLSFCFPLPFFSFPSLLFFPSPFLFSFSFLPFILFSSPLFIFSFIFSLPFIFSSFPLFPLFLLYFFPSFHIVLSSPYFFPFLNFPFLSFSFPFPFSFPSVFPHPFLFFLH